MSRVQIITDENLLKDRTVATQKVYNSKIEQFVKCLAAGKNITASGFYGEIRGIAETASAMGLKLDHSMFEKHREVFLAIHKMANAEKDCGN